MSKHITSRILSSFLFLLLVTSCSQSPTPPFILTATPPPPATDTSIPDPSLPTDMPTVVATVQPGLERPQYVLDLQMNYAAKAANVNETIVYPNRTGETLTNLVLAVEPNLWSGGFSLKTMTIDGQPVTSYTIENMNQRLEVQLPQPLPPSATLTLEINYGLILPQMQAYINASNDIRPQIYGYSARSE